MILLNTFKKWTIPALIAVYIVYTTLMAQVFPMIYGHYDDGAEKTRNLMCADSDNVHFEDISHDKLRGSTKYRTISALDLPPEDSPADVPTISKDVPISRFPKALLLGFAKCGTSTLLAFLNIHPDIVTLDWETDYFCDRVYSKYSLHWYRMRMPVSTRRQVTIEKSPCYITEPQALDRAKAMNSSIKVMVIVRNPLTKILSEHSHYLQSAKHLGKKAMSIEDRYLDKKGEVKENRANKNGVYADRVEHLFSVLPKSQILLLDGDAFITDPLSQLQRVETFLGVRPLFSEDDLYFDKDKGFYCLTDKETGCMGQQKGRKHVQMDPFLRQKLLHYLRPHSERFFSIVGHRFNWNE